MKQLKIRLLALCGWYWRLHRWHLLLLKHPVRLFRYLVLEASFANVRVHSRELNATTMRTA